MSLPYSQPEMADSKAPAVQDEPPGHDNDGGGGGDGGGGMSALAVEDRSRLNCSDRFRSSSIGNIIVTGAGFAADAYDLFVMNSVLVVLSFADPEAVSDQNGGKGLVATIVLVGSVIGQILFGLIADRIGRRRGTHPPRATGTRDWDLA
jgi:hypothetical protein